MGVNIWERMVFDLTGKPSGYLEHKARIHREVRLCFDLHSLE
jgi:hypothetical protein